MVGTPGIDQPRDFRVLHERDGNGGGRVGLPAHAQVQRLETFQQHPGIEGRHRGAGLPQQHVDVLVDEFLRPENDAAETTALAVDMFGCRIDDAVGAEREGALPQRRREHVVDHQRRAGLMRDLRNRRNVDDLQCRVRWTLEEQGLGIRPYRASPLLEIEPVDERR